VYRIVHNPTTDRYRVEKRGLLGWAFVNDKTSGNYLEFRDIEAAKAWICATTGVKDLPGRRWQVVSDCGC
jgi:hypothetical protein